MKTKKEIIKELFKNPILARYPLDEFWFDWGFKKAVDEIIKDIKDLKFTGKFKGIDKENDKAYRKGYNNALKDLKERIENVNRQRNNR